MQSRVDYKSGQVQAIDIYKSLMQVHKNQKIVLADMTARLKNFQNKDFIEGYATQLKQLAKGAK